MERLWTGSRMFTTLAGNKDLARTHKREARIAIGYLLDQTNDLRPYAYRNFRLEDGSTVGVKVWRGNGVSRATVRIWSPAFGEEEITTCPFCSTYTIVTSLFRWKFWGTTTGKMYARHIDPTYVPITENGVWVNKGDVFYDRDPVCFYENQDYSFISKPLLFTHPSTYGFVLVYASWICPTEKPVKAALFGVWLGSPNFPSINNESKVTEEQVYTFPWGSSTSLFRYSANEEPYNLWKNPPAGTLGWTWTDTYRAWKWEFAGREEGNTDEFVPKFELIRDGVVQETPRIPCGTVRQTVNEVFENITKFVLKESTAEGPVYWATPGIRYYGMPWWGDFPGTTDDYPLNWKNAVLIQVDEFNTNLP